MSASGLRAFWGRGVPAAWPTATSITGSSWACRPKPAASSSASNPTDRKSTRLNSSHGYISYAVFCLNKKVVEDRGVLAFSAATGELVFALMFAIGAGMPAPTGVAVGAVVSLFLGGVTPSALHWLVVV